MKKLIIWVIIIIVLIINYAYAEASVGAEGKTDYIVLTMNMTGKITITDGGKTDVYVDADGKKYNLMKDLDVVLEQLNEKGFNIQTSYIIGIYPYIILKRTK